MNSEELNRTIEFIIQSQARLAAAQEQDRQDRGRFEAWSTRLLEDMAVNRERTVELLRIQSSRLDRAEREDRAAQRRHEESQRRYDESQKESQKHYAESQKRYDESQKRYEESHKRYEESHKRYEELSSRILDRLDSIFARLDAILERLTLRPT